jgi:hypothetical protein
MIDLNACQFQFRHTLLLIRHFFAQVSVQICRLVFAGFGHGIGERYRLMACLVLASRSCMQNIHSRQLSYRFDTGTYCD